MSLTNGVITVLPAPEGYVVDFDNPQRIAVPEAYYISGITTFLGCLMMAQRLYTKIALVRKFQWDDGEWLSLEEGEMISLTGTVFLVLSWFISLSVVGMCTCRSRTRRRIRDYLLIRNSHVHAQGWRRPWLGD